MTEIESLTNGGVENTEYGKWANLGNEVTFRQNASERLSEETEKIDRKKFGTVLKQIAAHPAFSFEKSGFDPFYDESKETDLYDAISELKSEVDTKHTDLPIPDRLETILAEDEEKYRFNNDYHDTTARTAHGLLRGEGANCIGFSETCCLMLSLYGYKPTPVLSRLNKSGAACHYVTCFENEDGKVEIIDPERKRSCDEVEKQYSLTAYQGSLRYAVPTDDFSRVKIGGNSGIGPTFDEYFADKQEQVVKPITDMMRRLEREKDDISMYEQSTPTTRINLKANSMSARKKDLLDNVISDTLRPIYEQSLALMGEE